DVLEPEGAARFRVAPDLVGTDALEPVVRVDGVRLVWPRGQAGRELTLVRAARRTLPLKSRAQPRSGQAAGAVEPGRVGLSVVDGDSGHGKAGPVLWRGILPAAVAKGLSGARDVGPARALRLQAVLPEAGPQLDHPYLSLEGL